MHKHSHDARGMRVLTEDTQRRMIHMLLQLWMAQIYN